MLPLIISSFVYLCPLFSFRLANSFRFYFIAKSAFEFIHSPFNFNSLAMHDHFSTPLPDCSLLDHMPAPVLPSSYTCVCSFLLPGSPCFKFSCSFFLFGQKIWLDQILQGHLLDYSFLKEIFLFSPNQQFAGGLCWERSEPCPTVDRIFLMTRALYVSSLSLISPQPMNIYVTHRYHNERCVGFHSSRSDPRQTAWK